MKKPVVLRIYKGEQLQVVKQFMEPQIVLGRQSEAQVVLEGANVAVIHAVIEEREGGSYYICDLGSETGTFRNGERVLDSVIEQGDALTIGDYKIEFYIGVPKPKAPPPTGSVSAHAESISPVTAAPAPELVAVATPVSTPVATPVATQLPTESVTPASVAPVAHPSAAPVMVAATPAVVAAPPGVAPVVPQNVSNQPASATVESSAAAVGEGTIPGVPMPREVAPAPEATVVFVPPVSKSAPTAASIQPAVKKPVQTSAQVKAPASVPTAPPALEMAAAGAGMGSMSMVTPADVAASVARRTSKFVSPTAHKKHSRYGKTFAPPSRHKEISDFVRPSKGTVVEVLVAWRERVIATHHFTEKRTITMGYHPDNDVVLPVFASNAKVRKMPFLKISATTAMAILQPEMTGELIRGQATSTFIELVRTNRMVKGGNNYNLTLEQGEMLKVNLTEDVSLIIRYVSDSPKPLVAPFLDLTTSEFTGVMLSLVLVGVIWLYMFLYPPLSTLDDAGLPKEPIRAAILFVAPTPPPLPPPVKVEARPAPTPMATPPPVVAKATPSPKKVEQPKPVAQQAKAVTNLTKKQDPGKSQAAAQTRNKTGPRELTSPKQGGAVAVAKREGQQMKSPKTDVSKLGVFSTLGPGGRQDRIDQSTNGAGELAGLANKATGTAGAAANRAGKGLGSELKDTGVGGNGKNLEGIAGGNPTTSGRGGGNTGYGVGGLGNKTGIQIRAGGEEAVFSGTIDPEAIRRVIMQKTMVLRACYQRELSHDEGINGKVVVEFEIGEQGRVLTARVKTNETGNQAVADCVVRNLKGWRFPEPPTNQQVSVSYPFVFSN